MSTCTVCGIVEDFIGQRADILGHGGREEERLPFGRQLLEDAANVGQKAHIAHAIGFIQHQHFDMREVDMPVAEQIEQSAGTGHDDLGAAVAVSGSEVVCSTPP